MSLLVLDASIALCWCFEDEALEAADRLLERLQTGTAAVPTLWFLEIANALALAERRHRITPAEIVEFVGLLQALELEVDTDASARAFSQILDLARRERLTAYDAAYLELAMRRALPLASVDRKLCAAAERVGVTVLSA